MASVRFCICGVLAVTFLLTTVVEAQRMKLLMRSQVFDKALSRPMSKRMRDKIIRLKKANPQILQATGKKAKPKSDRAIWVRRNYVVAMHSEPDYRAFSDGDTTDTVFRVAKGRTGRRSWDLNFERYFEGSGITHHIRSKTLQNGLTLEVTGSTYLLMDSAGKVQDRGSFKSLISRTKRGSEKQKIQSQFGMQASDLRGLLNNYK